MNFLGAGTIQMLKTPKCRLHHITTMVIDAPRPLYSQCKFSLKRNNSIQFTNAMTGFPTSANESGASLVRG